MNILLVAEEAAGGQSLRLVLNSNHTLAGVLTTVNTSDANTCESHKDVLERTNSRQMNSSISSIASRFGIQVEDARQVKDPGFSDWIKSKQIDVLLNVHSLYRVCSKVIGAVRVGTFNLHPGLLPAYSGLNIPSWAVYNEEPIHAVTVHRMSRGIDTGDIVYEKPFPLTSVDTGLSVSMKCVKNGMKLIELLLTDLGTDPLSIPSKPQNLSKRTLYRRNDVPGNGFIQWSEPAHRIDAFVRACNYSPFKSPWGDPKTFWAGNEFTILETEVSARRCHEDPGTIGRMINGKTAIATKDYWLLIHSCKLSGKSVDASSFLKQDDKLTSVY